MTCLKLIMENRLWKKTDGNRYTGRDTGKERDFFHLYINIHILESIEVPVLDIKFMGGFFIS